MPAQVEKLLDEVEAASPPGGDAAAGDLDARVRLNERVASEVGQFSNDALVCSCRLLRNLLAADNTWIASWPRARHLPSQFLFLCLRCHALSYRRMHPASAVTAAVSPVLKWANMVALNYVMTSVWLCDMHL